MTTWQRSALATLALLVLTAPALAFNVSAPARIVADADGHFAVPLSIQAGPDGATLAAVWLQGTENCGDYFIADYFCSLVIEPFQTYESVWEGNLDDPDVLGRVTLTAEFCDDNPTTSVDVIVYPFGTVADEDTSWGTLKARYQ